ncbi:AAA family ATPase, partial [Acidithiobacillus sp. CV18-2]|nr:AAA family ATPase [Acidithiobacillus sp. CV18-3]MBU2758556.1 AAA family ATPase [Acidithiobacillus sp. BN09-2]MBU2777595.1 AAA family ATPase [Acidithiobacillus sp. CV18-2]MBU2799200.1 AAA family ATPase [Acidithiobacillus sp. VAN18-4]
MIELNVEDLLQAPEPAPAFSLPSVSIADLWSNPDPAPRFIWQGRIPAGFVTLLAAHGGTGKSVLSLQLAACVAAGKQFLGSDTEQGNVVFWSAEDGKSVIRQRLAHVTTKHGIGTDLLAERMQIIDATTSPTLFRETAIAGIREGTTTPAFDYLNDLLHQRHCNLLVVDNASDCFDANENERRHVRGFVRSLARLAADHGLAVLLLAHVQKSAAERGSTQSYSGSSAWNNSARSRLAMVKDPRTGEVLLTHEKCNVAGLAAPFRLAFTLGGLLVEAAPSIEFDAGQEVDAQVSILRLLADFVERDELVSAAPNAPRTNPWALFSKDPTFPRFYRNAGELMGGLRDLNRQGLITRETIRTEARKYREIWTLTPEGWARIGKSAPSAPSAPTPEVGTLGAAGADNSAPSAPSSALGVRGESAHTLGAQLGAAS